MNCLANLRYKLFRKSVDGIGLLFESVVCVLLYLFLFDGGYSLFNLLYLLFFHLLIFNQVIVIVHASLFTIECHRTVHMLLYMVLAKNGVARGSKLEILAI